ncbi:prolipoprotein diacylglyceryl transferase [Alicyclobacillus cellulosilyticus]|uniref:Phosphatidylglycerol--prolipoprotein diacylglyceryl transferase n=1 Tax=Alicyclobacillus cellulosilyticus TaxID=1003997 RepID=A0A917KFL2_9BACL|nr:prolipoprotein diacylglyceryl transferase [Alicyclobacillus cellulosilyticus]GGJ10137.1 prolipoprotein diacylglyceryl transferase [Alicyclobacillus cellulosilyticus]
MHPFWFWIGPYPVRAYSTLFALAFLLGLGVTLYVAKAEGKTAYVPHIWNLAPLLLLGGLIGSRFWQVFFFSWPYYAQHPEEIPAIWHGGLSIQGGVVGAGLVGLWYAWRHRLDILSFADTFAPGLLLGQSIGRDANLLNGDAFGDPTHRGFGIVYPPGSLAFQTYGAQPLWPAEVWEGQADVILFALLLVLLQRRWPAGFSFFYYLFTYNAARFGLEMLRGDSPRYLLHWDAAQWTAAPLALLGLAGFVYIFWQDRRRKVYR